MTTKNTRVDDDGRAYAGSQLQIQIYVKQRSEELTREVFERLPGLALLHPRLDWVSPLKKDRFSEYQDTAFLKACGLEHLSDELKAFWPRRGPVWDALLLPLSSQRIRTIKASCSLKPRATRGRYMESGAKHHLHPERKSKMPSIEPKSGVGFQQILTGPARFINQPTAWRISISFARFQECPPGSPTSILSMIHIHQLTAKHGKSN